METNNSGASHREAVDIMVTIPATTRDVGELLSLEHSRQKAENRACLLKVLSNVRFYVSKDVQFVVTEMKLSNFHQLLKH